MIVGPSQSLSLEPLEIRIKSIAFGKVSAHLISFISFHLVPSRFIFRFLIVIALSHSPKVSASAVPNAVAAFQAKIHALNVFSDYHLPSQSTLAQYHQHRHV